MTEVQNVGVITNQTQTTAKEGQKKYALIPSFKAQNDSFTRQLSPQQQQQKALEEYQKEQKKQKTRQNISLGVSICAGIAIIASVVMSAISMKKGGFDGLRTRIEQEALQLMPTDVNKIIDRNPNSYSDELKGALDRLMELLTRGDLKEKGTNAVAQIQLAGPGGTGKTDVAGVIAKKVIKAFPGSEYYIPDLSMLSSSSFKGQDVQMLTEYTQTLVKRAKELAANSKNGKKQYLICFLDEFDKIAMKDFSHNIHESNKTTGALKTLINTLMEQENVILISATNYPELIEGAVSSRMSEKVFVDYLNPKQIITAITENYKDPSKSKIASEIKDVANERLKKICDIIGKKEHQMEYRKLGNIIKSTNILSSKTGDVEINDLIKALTEIAGIYGKDGLNLSQAEINELKKLIV